MNATQRDELLSLQQEHDQLEQEVQEWRQWWKELGELGQPRLEEMGARVARFRQHLAAHFQHEEFRGPLAGPAPSAFAPQIAAVWKEHADLLSELDRLASRLQDSDCQAACWGAARAEFETFLDRLHRHEQFEAQVILSMACGEVS